MKPENKHLDGKNHLWFTILTLLFVFLAAGFLFSGLSAPPGPKDTVPLSPDFHTPKTARADILKAKTLVGNCFICHMGMVPDPDVIQPRFSHRSIELAHGKNDRCYNCHLVQDRNLFTPEYGPGIVHRNVPDLCRRCHGVIYNDWKNGTHGSKKGFWQDATEFNTKTLVCTQCHDPHSPKFHFKESAPPPVWPEKFIRNTKHEKTPGKNPPLAGKET